MHSVSKKIVTRANVTITSDIYGQYNRKVTAITDQGLFVGVMTERDTMFLPLGRYPNVLIQLDKFFSGRTLVSKLLPDSDC